MTMATATATATTTAMATATATATAKTVTMTMTITVTITIIMETLFSLIFMPFDNWKVIYNWLLESIIKETEKEITRLKS